MPAAQRAVRAGAPGQDPEPGQTQLQGRPGGPRRRDGRPGPAAPKEVGLKRVELERLRGGASLNMPEQEIQQLPDGGYRIVAAPSLPVEDWNAQISLMTGMAAADLMLEGKVGILRTMPAPDERSLLHFRRQTARTGKALGRPGQLRRVPPVP